MILLLSKSKVSVFFSQHLHKNSRPDYLLFSDKHRRVVIQLPFESTSLSLQERISLKVVLYILFKFCQALYGTTERLAGWMDG